MKITTSQNIDIDYAVAGLGDRILAWLIDYGIFVGVLIVFQIIMSIYVYVTHYQNVLGNGFPLAQVITIAIWLVSFLFYDLLCEIFMNGQSFGKKLMKIKVISLDGGRPRAGQYIMRWLFRIVDIGITTGSAAIIGISLTDNKQRIGDLVAGTAVINLKPKQDIDGLVFSPPAADYQPFYNEVMQLTDNDVVLIHDVIRNFNYTRNSMLVYKLAMQLKKYMNVSYDSSINEYQFLEIVLNDYNSLTAKSEQ